nr:phospholipid scramblase-related protein [Corynebacterium lactis]
MDAQQTPQQMPPQMPPLLQHNTLIIRQSRTFLRDDFFIFDPNGRKVATIAESGSELKKLFGLTRRFHVAGVEGDGRVGTPIFEVSDPYNIIGDSYTIFDCPGGEQLATVRRGLIPLRARLTLSIEGFDDIEIDGGIMAFDFRLTSGGREIARIDKKWNGLAKEFFGKQTYVLHLAPELGRQQRIGIIGAVLAIDLVKSKMRDFGASIFD